MSDESERIEELYLKCMKLAERVELLERQEQEFKMIIFSEKGHKLPLKDNVVELERKVEQLEKDFNVFKGVFEHKKLVMETWARDTIQLKKEVAQLKIDQNKFEDGIVAVIADLKNRISANTTDCSKAMVNVKEEVADLDTIVGNWSDEWTKLDKQVAELKQAQDVMYKSFDRDVGDIKQNAIPRLKSEIDSLKQYKLAHGINDNFCKAKILELKEEVAEFKKVFNDTLDGKEIIPFGTADLCKQIADLKHTISTQSDIIEILTKEVAELKTRADSQFTKLLRLSELLKNNNIYSEKDRFTFEKVDVRRSKPEKLLYSCVNCMKHFNNINQLEFFLQEDPLEEGNRFYYCPNCGKEHINFWIREIIYPMEDYVEAKPELDVFERNSIVVPINEWQTLKNCEAKLNIVLANPHVLFKKEPKPEPIYDKNPLCGHDYEKPCIYENTNCYNTVGACNISNEYRHYKVKDSDGRDKK